MRDGESGPHKVSGPVGSPGTVEVGTGVGDRVPDRVNHELSFSL